MMRHLPPTQKNAAGVIGIDSLLLGLQRLDRLIEQALKVAPATYGSEAASDPYQGLYISRDEVERMLSCPPCAPTLWTDEENLNEPWSNRVSEVSQIGWLQRSFELSPFDLDLILIALAPELDLRYERLYAYFQNDVTRKYPSVELALNLLSPSAAAKLVRRQHFAPNAPLIRQELLHLIPDPNQVQPPLLAHYLKLDEQIVRLLLGQEGIDPRLASFCQLSQPVVSLKELPLTAQLKQSMGVLAVQRREVHRPLPLYFQGLPDTSKRRVVEAIARHLSMSLLTVDLVRVLETQTNVESIWQLLFREAWFQDAVLYLDGFDTLHQQNCTVPYQSLMDMLAVDAGITILAGVQPWIPVAKYQIGVIPVSFPIPDFAQRQAYWQAYLADANVTLDPKDLSALADRFRLTPDQIANAVATASNHACWRAAARFEDEPVAKFSEHLTLNDLFAAARTQAGHDLATLARKIDPKYTWSDIVLASDQMAQLRELCDRAKHRHIVYGEWGFERKLSLGKGLNVLFCGPPGTGKTMAAEVIANELQLDLYKIDLSQIVSKYIGETEKNLDRIFTAAQTANAILFFDEADALFGKRSEVKDAHDRYANIEVGYLLQKMEEYEGIAILATNLRQNLDDAFMRRIQVIIDFPFPDEEHRHRIWGVIFPQEAPLGDDVDLGVLAREIKLAGGNIKNIGLAAAFYAANEGSAIRMQHLIEAARREHQKLGRTWHEFEKLSHSEN
ncbi:MAG TPA: ATP-binding protein [Allocoleopsis sp.]